MKPSHFICLFSYLLFFQSCDSLSPKPNLFPILEAQANTYESNASLANSKLSAHYGQSQSSFVINKDEFVNVFNSASGCEKIRISFAETDQNKLIYGFKFLDNNNGLINGLVYDFDELNPVKSYTKDDFKHRLNKYGEAGNTKFILDGLKPTITPTSGGAPVYQNTNTFGMEFCKTELDNFLNYPGTEFETILVKIGLYSNETIDKYIFNNVIMLNFYRAKANGSAIGGNYNVFDLNSLCPPGNCN